MSNRDRASHACQLGATRATGLGEDDTFDLVIRNGRWFDGTGAPSAQRDIGIRNGRVAAVSAAPLQTQRCPEVIEARGYWVTPGFIDIHTHYDLEILQNPGLGESVRHGVTSVVMGSCSLSAIHVNPLDCADLFSRVEALPREYVFDTLSEHKAWASAAEYRSTLESLPLGPNVAAMLGHSDLRAYVMGLGRATRSDIRPTESELRRMEALLAEALDSGMLGMSTMTSTFDKLDGDRFRSANLPTTYARWHEYRRLNRVLRRRRGVLQSAPNAAMPLNTLLFYAASCGVGVRPPLRVTLISAADAKSVRGLAPVLGRSAVISNHLLQSNLRWQHLPVPFEVYSDGIGLTAFEEFGAGAAALHIRDELERNELLIDTEYRRRFRHECDLRFTPKLWNRNFREAEITECPDAAVVGLTFGDIADSQGIHPADAFLDLVVAHGAAVRWRTTIANHRPHVLDKLAKDMGVHMGFADSGAHPRNAAFYNFPLRLLRRVHTAGESGHPFLTLEQAIHRLTGELAEWYGLAAGKLRVGDTADLVIIDPQHLDESLDAYYEAPMPSFNGFQRMVNRNDETVIATCIAGTVVCRRGKFLSGYGETICAGRFMRLHEGRAPDHDTA